MSIIPLLAQSAFDPETIETLVSVFEAAWQKVEQSGSKLASPAYKRAAQEIIAKRIIEMAQRGDIFKDRAFVAPQRQAAARSAHLRGRICPGNVKRRDMRISGARQK